MSKEPTYVTRPTLPPLEEYVEYLKSIWDSRWLSNSGPFHNQLELELCKFLNVDHISLFNNGTSALTASLQALDLKGEVITTPFSFLATTHSLLWNQLTPVFVDTNKSGFNLDPTEVEKAITKNTSAILAVHCYGHPCQTIKLQSLADKFNLKLVYDAAHCFGVEWYGESLLKAGDLSVLSFHATKVFNTFEGGAIVCHSEAMKQQLDSLKSFGMSQDGNADYIGINGKLNEASAALGLAQLKYQKDRAQKSQSLDVIYREQLANIKGLTVPAPPEGLHHNYSYFPVLITEDSSVSRDQLLQFLTENKVFAKKYFSPLLPDLRAYKGRFQQQGDLPNARKLSQSILCLPIYPDLEKSEVERITKLIRSGLETS